ncbi:hypothetical protein BGI41_08155 [Methanobrevibacter sp. 87.7]|uniref:hypothetical protein n=1 Tax=Methanobrevibacter sp. 87.7 TaxID=387957 RepID=UPI000B513EB6|nr:hypothetical protein [Methanobrevibacter sp. 87.7]OWT32344.1 hypothetical protein BGI41_08155 [Methanobrevibacter sp. 87.7]
MKKSYILIIIIIIICSLFGAISYILTDETAPSDYDLEKHNNTSNGLINKLYHKFNNKIHPDKSIIGYNENGTVHKYYYGNQSSNETIVVILGVHDLESGIHNATNETLNNLTKENKLSKKYVVYFVKINHNQNKYNTSEYNTNRHMGEMLANKFIVNDVAQYNPELVIDVHEMEVYYDRTTFLLPITENSKGEKDGQELANDIGIEKQATYSAGTSPQYVTEPIAHQNIETMIFEVNQGYSQETKNNYALKLIKALENF